MSEYPLHKFIDLITFDQTIVSLERQIEALSKEIAKNEQDIATYEIDVKRCQDHLASLRKGVDVLERSMQELDGQEKAKKHRLDTSANHKEYQSIKNELDALKKQQQTLEDQLLAAWKSFESYTVTFEEKKKFCQEKLNALNSIIAQTMQKQAALNTELQELIKTRTGKEEGIPAEWLEHYSAMRSKVSNPVVPLINNNCSACFYTITQRDIAELRRGVLLRCRDCFRFLYLPKDKPQSSQEGA